MGAKNSKRTHTHISIFELNAQNRARPVHITFRLDYAPNAKLRRCGANFCSDARADEPFTDARAPADRSGGIFAQEFDRCAVRSVVTLLRPSAAGVWPSYRDVVREKTQRQRARKMFRICGGCGGCTALMFTILYTTACVRVFIYVV